MKSLTIFLIISSIAALVASNKDHHAKWNEYKQGHGKRYHPEEDAVRKEIFIKVHSEIEEHNAGGHSYKKGHNHLSDKTEAEKQALLGTFVPESLRNGMRNEDPSLVELMLDRAVPATLDYRITSKCVGPVKNQGSCGSCWSFSAIAPLEYAYCRKYGGNYVSLSEQQLVDCDPNDKGCNGGWPSNAWYYLKYLSSGSETTTSYGYTAKNGTCQYSATKVLAKVSTYGSVASKNVAAMKTAIVTYGPLSVAIYVTSNFQYYKSGVFTDSTCPAGAVNHGVVVVGYGSNYWIVRNSWGSGWGESGYIRMAMGTNLCSIETYPAYVVAA